MIMRAMLKARLVRSDRIEQAVLTALLLVPVGRPEGRIGLDIEWVGACPGD